jgi:hypothetical protein
MKYRRDTIRTKGSTRMMVRAVLTSGFLICVFINPSSSATPSEDLNPTKGESLVKSMSQKLAAAQTFSFHTTEFHDRFNRSGQKVQLNMERDVLVRRPNGFWTKYTGDLGWEFWYDGKMLTGVFPAKKIYVQREMPPTIDDAMDMLAKRLNMDLPMSDVLYSSPYDAFMNAQTHGGYSGKEIINGSSCGHLVYGSAAVDWHLWINEKTSLPCKLEMTYKKEKGNSFFRITFSNWNMAAKIPENAFASKIPDGYVRVPILERVAIHPSGATQTQTGPTNP